MSNEFDEVAHRVNAIGYPDENDLCEELNEALIRATESFENAYYEIQAILYPESKIQNPKNQTNFKIAVNNSNGYFI